MTTPEFSRAYNVDTLGSAPRQVSIVAESAERAALAARFNLIAIDSLSAEAELVRSGDTISATGTLRAEAIQSCVASAEPVPETVNAPFEIHFRPQLETGGGDEEIELSGSELDVVFYEGGTVDLGEAVAETLSLSLDPYPRSPLADDALREAGVKNEEEAGPFAALAALRDKMK